MSKFVGILIALLVFSFIVFFHELGHYLFARLSGIMVEEFAIGMGPKIYGKKKGDTEYTIRALPIGGFCSMLGEDEHLADERSFNAKPMGSRLLTIFGGPLFNFILAFIFGIILILISGAVTTTTVSQVVEGFPAAEAGIQAGDRIVEINGHHVLTANELITYINVEKDQPLAMVVERQGQKKQITMQTAYLEEEKRHVIGIGYQVEEVGFLTAIKQSLIQTYSWIKITLYSFKSLIIGKVGVNQLSGPVGIIDGMSDGYSKSVSDGFLSVLALFINYTIIFSANLGVINLLPIPALDGGRLLFLLIEAVRGKPIDQKKEGYVHFVGFALLMVLMVVVLYGDIVKLLTAS